MRQFEVDYETTLPPWHIGHEKIEAEDLNTVKTKFYSKHESARLIKVIEILYNQFGWVQGETKQPAADRWSDSIYG